MEKRGREGGRERGRERGREGGRAPVNLGIHCVKMVGAGLIYEV